nr:hypothetical protein [Micromonospora orduensis]
MAYRSNAAGGYAARASSHRDSKCFLRPIFVRVIRLPDWVTYDGWLWIEGYELGPKGEAVVRWSPGSRRDAHPLPRVAVPGPPIARRAG